ncbi:hypothetical protein [Kitasatospora sp. NPDC058190]|uniref:hypothetical protein n=1 Tax=Kitasatospora sp. NPDC058190 TaxID=3346371 RepID=UPI0036D97971
MDRTFLYRHRDLLALVHAAEREPAGHDLAGGSPVTRTSLQADLANAQARNTRLTARIQQMERRLSEALGEQAWRESGLGAPPTSTNSSARSPGWNSTTSSWPPHWRRPGRTSTPHEQRTGI